MKKIFAFFAAALCAVSVNAEEVVLMENVADGTILNIADIEAAGGADDDIVTVYVTNKSGGDRNGWGIGGFGKASGWDTTVEMIGKEGDKWTYEFTVSLIKETAAGESGVRWRVWADYSIDKIALNPSISYAEGRALTIGEDGFIAASEFTGLSDDAKVEFTYTLSGTLTNPNGSGWKDWGIGRIGSNDDNGEGPSVVIGMLNATALGDLTFTCKFSAIKAALDVTPDGIVFALWNFGDGACTAERKSVVAYEVEGFSGTGFIPTGIREVNTRKTQVSDRFNLSGQKVGSSYKGLVIENGEKFVAK